jgi:hypothetical protein
VSAAFLLGCWGVSPLPHNSNIMPLYSSAFAKRRCSERSSASSTFTAFTEHSSSAFTVPETVFEKELLRDSITRKKFNQMQKVPLIKINCSFGLVTKGVDATILSNVVKTQCRTEKSDVTIVFAIRRPGCGFCREHGQQLSELAKSENVAMIGLVKDGVKAGDALLNLYTNHFRFPIFEDSKWEIYKLMGNRMLSTMQILKGVLSSRNRRRHAEKKIRTQITSDDTIVQGGLLVFDRCGKLRFAFVEDFGKSLDIEVLRTAIRAIRDTPALNETSHVFKPYDIESM